jgi:hypothetical protein
MLAITYMNYYRDDDAEQMLKEVIEIRTRTHGRDHSGTLGGMGQLGRLYIKQSRWREANEIMAEAVARSVKTRGDDHTATNVYRYRLGVTELQLGRLTEAERNLLKAYDVFTTLHGAGYVWAKRTATALMDLYEAKGNPSEVARYRATLDQEWLDFVERQRAMGISYD